MSLVSPLLEYQGHQENKSTAKGKACGDTAMIWGHLDQGTVTFIPKGLILAESGLLREAQVKQLLILGSRSMILYLLKTEY